MKKIKIFPFLSTIDVIIVSCITIFWAYISTCRIYDNYGFDAQSLLTWEYTSLIGLIPYKDIFYPYGLLFYLKPVSSFFYFLYIIIPIIISVILYITLVNLSRNKFLAFLFIIIFLVFSINHIWYDTYLRYAVVLGIGALYLYTRQVNCHIKYVYLFLIGVITGLVFTLMHDSAVYFNTVLIFYLLSVSINKAIVNHQKLTHILFYEAVELLSYLAGFVIGTIPFIWYLVMLGSVNSFIDNMRYLLLISHFAKTPFLPFSRSAENIFIFLVLFTAVYTVFYFHFFNKVKNFISHFLIFCSIYLILLEYRSIIRSIDQGITFIALFILILLIILVYTNLENQRRLYFSVFSICSLLYLLLIFPFHKISLNALLINSKFTQAACYSSNIDKAVTQNTQMKLVIDEIHWIKPSALVYSFPDDALFYVFNFQRPPYYFSTYDASPYHAQLRIIEYLRYMDFVIINVKTKALQDGVPDYIRTPHIAHFISFHFEFYKQIGEFRILKKVTNNTSLSPFAANVINLEYLPISEGKKLIASTDVKDVIYVSDIDKYLERNTVYTDNIGLVIQSSSNMENITRVEIIDVHNNRTVVEHVSCRKNELCFIRLNKIPLFYKNRQLKSIRISTSTSSRIGILHNVDKKYW